MDYTYPSLLEGRGYGGIPMAFLIVPLGAKHHDPFLIFRQTYQLLYGFVPAHVYASTTEVLATIEVFYVCFG